ncbi:MAG: TonB-dependent receptor, partial [Acidobacteria bacterium]|nr:TonB-dependent receptor [Acidobacteriota bacterium]
PDFPQISPVQTYGAGIPGDYIQGLGSPRDSFPNYPIGLYWQDSWRIRGNLTLNYGLRYDVEVPPTFRSPKGLAQSGYQLLGLQKGIATDTNNFQPRVGVAWDPKGDGKTVIRSSYGIFYDHPLLGLYFLGDASDGSTSGQLAFAGTAACGGPGNPANLNAITIFQGLVPMPNGSVNSPCSPTTNPAVLGLLNYSPNQQRFACDGSTGCGVTAELNSIFLGQNYLNSSSFLPLAFQPFGYPQAGNFVYAYSQQVNFGIERDLGRGFALELAYNFNGGRHLNRPINRNAIRGDLMIQNLVAAQRAAQAAGITPGDPNYPASPFTVGSSTAFPPCGVAGTQAYVPASLMNFFRPGGLNPSIAEALISSGAGACVTLADEIVASLKGQGFNAACNPLSGSVANCVPFGDMDANYSNGSSVYHGFSANLRKRFSGHYEFLASYTWSHAIDDSTDLQSTLTPQDSYYPGLDRASSTFDQRHRFVLSGVYQSGNVGHGFGGRLLSQWTFAPLIEFGSGRPFNIITGNGDNLQLSSLTGRPNTFVNPACGLVAYPAVHSRFSPTGVFQEPCPADFNGSLSSLDGDLGRNAGVTPWTVFDDVRIARKIPFSEHMSLDASVDIFNIANRFNVAA